MMSCGRMKINETHYYAIPSSDSDNINIFRLNINGETVLSDAKYQSGWYPANAVDSLFGNVISNGGTGDLQARQDIETQYRNAMVKATKKYMAVALKPSSTQAQIQQAMQVRRRVLAYPSLAEKVPNSAVIVDYNPSKGVAERHANEKLVFILSANPDAVVGNIKNFAESDQTALAVSHLAKVTSQRVRNEVVAEEAKEAIDKYAIKVQLDRSIAMLENTKKTADKKQIKAQIDILIEFLEGAK